MRHIFKLFVLKKQIHFLTHTCTLSCVCVCECICVCMCMCLNVNISLRRVMFVEGSVEYESNEMHIQNGGQKKRREKEFEKKNYRVCSELLISALTRKLLTYEKQLFAKRKL